MLKIIACLLLLIAPQWALAQAPLARIVVFGTSLSDPGNAFALVGGTSTPPDYSLDPFLIPSAPYTGGGAGSHHFSNGPTWVEQLARPLGLSQSTKPAFRDASGGASNYAIGGARARNVDGASLSNQVAAFLRDTGGAAPDALYVVEMGGNDLRDALAAILISGDPHAGDLILQEALTAIGDNIFQLWRSGAKKFLVWNAPNIGLTPAIRGIPSPLPALIAGQLAQGFNENLDATVLAPLRGLPGIQIVGLDVNTKLNDLFTNPARFDLRIGKSIRDRPRNVS